MMVLDTPPNPLKKKSPLVAFGYLDLDLEFKSIDLKCLDLKSIDFKIFCLDPFIQRRI
jgi:hypothetical protein